MLKGAPPLVLFVCQGNICRSPMMAALAEDAARRAGLDIAVASAGTAALIGDPAEPSARACIAELGLDLSAHRARQVTPDMIASALLVVTASAAQRDWLRRLASEHADRVVALADLTAQGDVPDPWGRNAVEYRRVRGMIEEAMPALLDAVRSRVDQAKGAHPR